jgi:hypothetical protein
VRHLYFRKVGCQINSDCHLLANYYFFVYRIGIIIIIAQDLVKLIVYFCIMDFINGSHWGSIDKIGC